jgi:hypothetical protein
MYQYQQLFTFSSIHLMRERPEINVLQNENIGKKLQMLSILYAHKHGRNDELHRAINPFHVNQKKIFDLESLYLQKSYVFVNNTLHRKVLYLLKIKHIHDIRF